MIYGGNTNIKSIPVVEDNSNWKASDYLSKIDSIAETFNALLILEENNVLLEFDMASLKAKIKEKWEAFVKWIKDFFAKLINAIKKFFKQDDESRIKRLKEKVAKLEAKRKTTNEDTELLNLVNEKIVTEALSDEDLSLNFYGYKIGDNEYCESLNNLDFESLFLNKEKGIAALFDLNFNLDDIKNSKFESEFEDLKKIEVVIGDSFKPGTNKGIFTCNNYNEYLTKLALFNLSVDKDEQLVESVANKFLASLKIVEQLKSDNEEIM